MFPAMQFLERGEQLPFAMTKYPFLHVSQRVIELLTNFSQLGSTNSQIFEPFLIVYPVKQDIQPREPPILQFTSIQLPLIILSWLFLHFKQSLF